MKIVRNLVEKVGSDYLLHFLLGGWLTALALPFGSKIVLGAIFVVYMLSGVKEYLDSLEEGNKADWWDIFAGVLGGVVTLGYAIIVG